MLTREAVRILVGHAESAADLPFTFMNVSELKKSWQVKGLYPYIVSYRLNLWVTHIFLYLSFRKDININIFVLHKLYDANSHLHCELGKVQSQ